MRKKFNFRFLLLLVAGIVMSLNAMAQSQTIKGHVQDQDGQPIAFASVVLLDTRAVVNTDANGFFTLTAAPGAAVRVSYLGYKTVETKATDNMLVVLEDNNTLEEAVVIGYGVVKKNDLTGSVTAIKPDEKNHGMITNAQDMIQGKIAGVAVTSDGGSPGGGANIRIRGGSSLNASNNPLIVIDGLAMDQSGVKGLSNPLSMVNPEDIETFTVLKDASATAIYGSRGSNGVIIITTKKGRVDQKPKVTYNGYVSLSTRQKGIDVLDADEYRNFITDYYGADSDAAGKLGPSRAKAPTGRTRSIASPSATTTT